MVETNTPTPIIGKLKVLRDGKTGEAYDQPQLEYMTFLKLHHLVEDKVHARSTGPYSLVTQQPRRLERHNLADSALARWRSGALEAYGATYTLQNAHN